jgi:hypothetical protein
MIESPGWSVSKLKLRGINYCSNLEGSSELEILAYISFAKANNNKSKVWQDVAGGRL